MSISFDTPSLLYLEYSDEVARYYPKVNLPNLVEAVLDLNIRDLDYMKLYRERNDDGLRNYVVLRCGNLCKLMTRIGNLFSICFESMPTFNNLKMLRISGSVHPVGWQAMPVLLQNCPHLETLQMEYLCVWDCISLEEKGGWLISCPVEKIVEKILIEMFRGTKGAIGTVKHLLESLSCLKEITLFAGRDYPTDIFDLVVKMVNLCNGSYRTELW
ncbi:PREDICTED: F-box/LRR-repeat protein At3g58930-like [Brassica oleracea var. oleracea]|uniref:F-box/LRR-repeat protein At3g58930-like n=1 Tax=Brassica oleracea var. oleracea TaxID=109376 RepID=UPI0006A6DEC4|nr:PREDICTED: F-box/LRR-repeat protein At3g58930-like [Brassica oleracea var. oleracea]